MNPLAVQSVAIPAQKSLSATRRLWELGGLSWWHLIQRTRRGYRENHFDARSAQFAYYAMLAIFPLLILLIAAVAELRIHGVLENAIDATRRAMPDNVERLLERQVHDIQERSSLSLLAISLFLLILAGSRVFLTLNKGLNTAYGVRDTRHSGILFAGAMVLTVAASLLTLIAMILMVVGPVLSQWLDGLPIQLGWLGLLLQRGVRWVVVCATLWISTSTVYCLGPGNNLPWYWLSPGSVVATIGCIVVSQGFRLYVENVGQFNQTYGTLGGAIALLVWLDLTGGVLFLGGQVNAVIHRAEAERAAAVTTPIP